MSSISVRVVAFVALALVAPPLASPASAQSDTAIQLKQFEPEAGSADIMGVQSAAVNGHLFWQIGIYGNIADDVFEVRDTEGMVLARLIDDQTELDVVASLGLGSRIELGLVVPVTVHRNSQEFGDLPIELETAGLGNVRLIPKLRLTGLSSRLGLALSAPVRLPTSADNGFFGDSGISLEPRIIAEYVAASGLQLAMNAGVWLRSEQQFVNLKVGTELTYAIGARAPFTVGNQPFAAVTTLVGSLSLEERDSEEVPLEWLAGVEYYGLKGAVIGVSGGPGVSSGYGTPDFRVLARVALRRQPAKAPPPRQCLSGPEDIDGFEDDDACEDPDNDRDGITDFDDLCPNEAELVNGVADHDGCPEDPSLQDGSDRRPQGTDQTEEGTGAMELVPLRDEDGDGIIGDDDVCPDIAEDPDGYEDLDGCPEGDNDRDGITDTNDRCPLEAEVINGVEDDDGCADKGKVLVQVQQKRILILDKIYFDTNKATIQAKSFNVLNQVAATLQANLQITKLRIEGHTDAQGNDDYNLTLSQARTDAVRQYLQSRGVDASRLESRGYGETQPLATNNTTAGRAQNRRVEFTIVEINGKPAPAEPASQE